MRAFGWFIITLLLGACSADEPSKKCIYPAGDLFFSKEKAGWDECNESSEAPLRSYRI